MKKVSTSFMKRLVLPFRWESTGRYPFKRRSLYIKIYRSFVYGQTSDCGKGKKGSNPGRSPIALLIESATGSDVDLGYEYVAHI